MKCTIIFDDYTGLRHSKSSNSNDLHQDLINLFKDEYNVIEVYGDDDDVYSNVGNYPIIPNVMECEFQ
jgi:hypothetical protein